MKKILNIFISLIFSLLLVTLVSAQQYAGCGSWMMGYGTGAWSFMWIFGFIFWILILIALILFIAWLVKQLQHPKRK